MQRGIRREAEFLWLRRKTRPWWSLQDAGQSTDGSHTLCTCLVYMRFGLDCGICVYNTVWLRRWIPSFWRNLLFFTLFVFYPEDGGWNSVRNSGYRLWDYTLLCLGRQQCACVLDTLVLSSIFAIFNIANLCILQIVDVYACFVLD